MDSPKSPWERPRPEDSFAAENRPTPESEAGDSAESSFSAGPLPPKLDDHLAKESASRPVDGAPAGYPSGAAPFSAGAGAANNFPPNRPTPGGFPGGNFPPVGPPRPIPAWNYPPAPKKSGGLLWKLAAFFFGGIFVFFLGVMILGAMGVFLGAGGSTSKVAEKTLSGSETSPKKIVILPIEGTITENEDGFIRNAIRKAREDERLAGLILRINSPGGTLSGSDYYYHLLRELKRERGVPIVVSMGPITASGGYYISMVADEIYAERSTITGSIGVITMIPNASGLCEKLGVSMNVIASGPNKGMGDMTRPMTPAERAIWQGVVDDAYRQFLEVVREGRPRFAEKKESKKGKDVKSGEEESDDLFGSDESKDEKDTKAPEEGKTLEEIADGRIYTASEAKKLGLIDEIGFLDDTVSAVKKRGRISDSEVQVVRYKKPEGLADLLTQAEAESASAKTSAMIDRVSTPTIYYLTPGALPVE